MAFEFVTPEEAIRRRGLRLVVVGQVPSAWGESAKGIFHLKGLDFAAVRLVYDNEALKAWTGGELSGPVAVYDDEPPRSGWAEILMLAERLAPEPPLLPSDPQARSQALLLAEDLCGRDGLGWNRRLQMIHAGLTGVGGFSSKIAAYLGSKYGYDRTRAARTDARVVELLGKLAAALRAQRAAGHSYFLGATVSAVDVYAAAFMAFFKPLPEEHCAMHAGIRAAFEWLDTDTAAALDPVLLEHRGMMYSRHLPLPLSL